VSPKVTVTLGSNRPGGIDIALAGLVGQTYQDFEVVFVDGRYYKRHAQVLEAVKRSGLKQPFFHVPNHRYSDGIWGTTCAGYNTGFMLAAGEIVVMLLDYTYAPPEWLATHVAHQEKPKIIMAPHEYRFLHGVCAWGAEPVIEFDRRGAWYADPADAVREISRQRDRFDEISIFEEPFISDQLELFVVEPERDVKCGMVTGPFNWSVFNTKNESFPLEAILDINGMDENYDRGRGPGDPDLGLRLARTGLELWVVQEAIVHCLNPRRILPNLNIVLSEARLPEYPERWAVVDGDTYFEKVKLKPEALALNPFSIRQRRDEIWHWRDLAQREAAAIPINVVSDNIYFRG
jgi:glycosyltransferase involved in cell wall biosynthesis